MSIKKERLAKEVKTAVSGIIMSEIQDPRLGFVTVMRVEMADDFRSAKVHVAVLGTPEQTRSSMRCLADATGFVQGLLGKRLKTRYTPTITWIEDHSVEKSIRISNILKRELGDTEEGGKEED